MYKRWKDFCHRRMGNFRGGSEYGEYMDCKDISGPKPGHTEKFL